jgi:hypothetical protein
MAEMKRKKTLPRSNNGIKRKTASLGCYQYQKDELIRRAAHDGCSVSYYLNKLLWKDWLFEQEKRAK